MFIADIAERLTSDSERVKFYTWMALKVSAQVLSLAFSLINHEISYTDKLTQLQQQRKKNHSKAKDKDKERFSRRNKNYSNP